MFLKLYSILVIGEDLASESFIGLDGFQLGFGDSGDEIGGLANFMRNLHGGRHTSAVMLSEGVLFLTWLFLNSRLMRVLGAPFSYLS